ncbi:HlyD family efflux transporter periplasmic adaptor subunit [Massilia arenosa]|uniref:HlyD family efflux transporter periplasmic adaptor subunit n=1 Tax=Zemynaea arenosa TaxID=2561931 RepID=A0A4Y9RT40_9BURK|nr:HlyD family efflux transporter periplasmic adaptor subunit [Massilia arenosa]TFW11451.1 HlyD family efflux transporter periplasmic adaptor subunit [Massilia arenosa]
MDQPLDPRIQTRQRRLRMLAAVAILATVAASAFGLNRLIRPAVSAQDVTIAVIQRGTLANTVSASGTVIPVHEEMVTSPVTTRVAKVVAKPGKEVAQGELLLQLDDKDIRLTIDGLHEQLAQQENKIAALTQELEQKRKQLVAAIELLQLDLKSAEARWQRFQKLRSSGAVSGEDLLTAELNVQRIQVQLRQQQEQIEDSKRSTRTSIDGALLQKSILQKQLAQQERQLASAQVRAPFAGVLTWLAEDEGATVNAGQVVARVSETSNFRVEATLSDFHAHSIAAGQAARIEHNGQTLTGKVQTVLPEIQNGTMKVLLALDQPHHPLLRNKLRVEAWIVTSGAAQTLVASAGPAFNGSGRQAVWVVGEGRAVKRELQIGASDGKNVEIASGATAGERLIVSDMSRYKDLDTLRVTQ